MKLDILAIGVHPDDVELSCSGTLLHQISLGYKVGLLDLTRGELGTRGNAELRTQEAIRAANMMGALVRDNCDLSDGFFRNDTPSFLKIVKAIRKYRPDIVLANALNDRHPDHGRAAQLTSDACFYAGLKKIETTDDAGVNQERWRPKALYHYIQDYHIEPDFVFDISPYMERKIELILAFSSQFYDPTSLEPATPISGSDFIEFIKAKNRHFGRPAGFEFAEGYNSGRYLGVRDLFHLL